MCETPETEGGYSVGVARKNVSFLPLFSFVGTPIALDSV